MNEQELKDLLVRIAECLAAHHGPDGDAYGFTGSGYPDDAGGFGNTKEEAALAFLSEMFPG